MAYMAPEPVPADPGWDDDLAWLDQDPVTAAEREAWLEHLAECDDPPEPEECEDWPELTAEELAEAYEPVVLLPLTASQGRPGPDQPGSARAAPGESSSLAASFGPGMVAGPRPGRRGRPEPEDHLVRDGDRRARTRGRPWLRQASAREPPETGRAGIRLHCPRPARPAPPILHV